MDRDACYTTKPVELLNPESTLTLGPDDVSGSRKLSIITSPLALRGDQTPTGQSAAEQTAHGEQSVHGNGAVEGTPASNSNGDISKASHRISFDSMADDRLGRLSIAESEGSAPAHITLS